MADLINKLFSFTHSLTLSFWFFETCSVAQVGLELLNFLPQPAKCWDYKCVPPYPATSYFLFIGGIGV
jgi:hypothetical protein